MYRRKLLMTKRDASIGWPPPTGTYTEDYSLHWFRIGSSKTPPSGYYLFRLSDDHIRYLSPMTNANNYQGYIYNHGMVRGNKLYLPSLNDDQGYFYSDDLGVTFTKVIVNSGLSGVYGTKASADGQYVIANHRSEGVWYSTDYGNSFTLIKTGTNYSYTCAINHTGQLMAFAQYVNDKGVWISQDYGANWIQHFPTVGMSACGITYNTNRLFYSDHYDSILYEFDFNTESGTQIYDSTNTNRYLFYGCDYSDSFITGSNNESLSDCGVMYDDPSTAFLSTAVTPNIDRYYAPYESYDGRIRSLSGNDNGIISFDYGNSWVIFDPSDYTTF